MMRREEFRAYMKATNSSSDYDGLHLSEANMIAYCRGDLSEAERETAQAHLVGCEQCVALFRNARDFLDPARGDERESTPAETNEAWQSLLERVQIVASTSARSSETKGVPVDFRRPQDKKSPSRVSLALAASLLISFGVLGLLGWGFWHERQSRRQAQEVAMQLESKQRELEGRLSQLENSGNDQLKREREQRLAAEAERDQLQALLAAAQPGRPKIPVYPFSLSSERGSEEELRLKLTSGAPAVRLRLFRNKPYEFPEYAIQLIDQRGEVVREISRLRPSSDNGALSFLLNRATLSTGKYKLRLFGQGKTKQQLGEYRLSVTVER